MHTDDEMPALPASIWRQICACLSFPADRLRLKMTSKAMLQRCAGVSFPYTECWDANNLLAVAEEAGQGHQHVKLFALAACREAVSLRSLVSLKHMDLLYGDDDPDLSLGVLGQYELSCVPKGVTQLAILCSNLPHNVPYTHPPDLDLGSLKRLCKLTFLEMAFFTAGQRKFTAAQWSSLQSLSSLQTLSLMQAHLLRDFCITSKLLHLCLCDCTADKQLVDLTAFATLTDVVLSRNTFCVQLPNSMKRLKVVYTGHEVDVERFWQPLTQLEEFLFDYLSDRVRVGEGEHLPSLPITSNMFQTLTSVPKHYLNWGCISECANLAGLTETGKVEKLRYKSTRHSFWVSHQDSSNIAFHTRFDTRFA